MSRQRPPVEQVAIPQRGQGQEDGQKTKRKTNRTASATNQLRTVAVFFWPRSHGSLDSTCATGIPRRPSQLAAELRSLRRKQVFGSRGNLKLDARTAPRPPTPTHTHARRTHARVRSQDTCLRMRCLDIFAKWPLPKIKVVQGVKGFHADDSRIRNTWQSFGTRHDACVKTFPGQPLADAGPASVGQFRGRPRWQRPQHRAPAAVPCLETGAWTDCAKTWRQGETTVSCSECSGPSCSACASPALKPAWSLLAIRASASHAA